MEWRRFEGNDDVPAFLDAAIELHRGAFDRLAAHERPHFLDWWLRLLNASRAWLLGDGATPQALVTVPHRDDTHEYRWTYRTLAVAPEAWGRLVLPRDVDLSRSFTMPGGPTTSPCADLLARPVQLGYVGTITDAGADHASASAYRFCRSIPDALPAIIALLARSYPPEGDGAVDLRRQRCELGQITRHDVGWCVHATTADDDAPIAMASYVVIHLPLVGVPAILVSDLAVDERHRRRGLAAALQRYAFGEMAAAGLHWLVGNIDPENQASRGQARRLGRLVWYTAVRLREPG